MLPLSVLNADQPFQAQAKDPARRALLKTFSFGAGGALLTGAPWVSALARQEKAPVIKNGWLLSRADLDGQNR